MAYCYMNEGHGWITNIVKAASENNVDNYVIYFSDGQNLVDRYLSAFGEWEFDKTVNRLMKEGYQGVIAVGIDCPKEPLERTKEFNKNLEGYD